MAGALGGLSSLGGSTLGQVLVKVGLDTKQLDAGMAKAKGEAAAAGSSFSKFGAYASAGFAVAGAAAVKFAVDAVASAQEHEAVIAQLKVVVGDATKAFEDQATALQNLTGFQDEEVLAADTVLARFKLTQAEIQQTIPLVLDYATATGKTAADSAGLLGKALLGNTRALKLIGIDYKATGDKAKDLANITELLQDKVGGASEAFGQTFAGKLAILRGKFDDLKETLGTALIPTISDAVDTLGSMADVIDAITHQKLPDFDDALKLINLDLLEKGLQAIHNPLGDFISQIRDAADVTSTVTIKSATYTGTLKDLRGAMDVASGAAARLAEAQRNAAEAAKAQHAAEKALAGGVVGLLASIDQHRAALRDLNAVRHDATSTSAEFRAAEINAIQTQLGVTASMTELIAKYKLGTAGASDVAAKFDALALKAGVQKSELDGLNAVVQRYISLLDRIPNAVNTMITVNRSIGARGGRTGGTDGHGESGDNGRGSGVNITIISPTDPAQAIINNIGAWQRQNRDWVG